MVGITVCALFFLLANLGHGSVVIDDPVQVAYINTMQDMFKDQLRAMSSMMLNMGSVFADVKFNNLMGSGDYETPQVPSSPFSLQVFSDQSREGRSPQEQTTYRSYLRGPSLFFFHDRKDTEPPCSKPFQTNYLRSVNINKPTDTQKQDQSSSFSDTSSDSASESSYSSSSSTEESSFSTSDNYEYSYSGLQDDDDDIFMDDSADDNDSNEDDSIYYITSNAPATTSTSGQGSGEEVVLIDKVSEDQVSAVDSSRDSGDNSGDSSEDSADMGMEERMRKPDEFYTAGSSSSAVIGSPEQVPSAAATTDAATDSAVPSDVTTTSDNGNIFYSADSVDSTTTTDVAAVDADQKQDNIGNINSNNNNDKYEDQKSASITTEQQQNSESMTLEQPGAVEPQEPLALSTTAGEIDSTDQSVLSDPPLTAHTDLHAIHQDMENRSMPELRE